MSQALVRWEALWAATQPTTGVQGEEAEASITVEAADKEVIKPN